MSRLLLAALLALPLLALASDFNMPDHFERSVFVKNGKQLDDLVKRAVKGIKYPAGHPLEGKKKRRTLFARFIAGEHHEECIQQSPGWNEVVLLFEGNPDVMFADVDLSSGGPRETDKLGLVASLKPEGGWPTVVHWNRKTKYKVRNYVKDKKTGMKTRHELGPKCRLSKDKRCNGRGGMLQAYIELYANTTVCQARPPFRKCGKRARERMTKQLRKYAKKSVSQMEEKLEQLVLEAKTKQFFRYPPPDKIWIRQQIGLIRFVQQEKLKKHSAAAQAQSSSSSSSASHADADADAAGKAGPEGGGQREAATEAEAGAGGPPDATRGQDGEAATKQNHPGGHEKAEL